MAASQWPAVVAALLTQLSADGTLAGKVYDGIPVTAESIADGVFIGVVLDEDTGDAGSIEQDWHEMGGIPPKDETGWIRCTVVSQRGDTDLSVPRTAAFALLAAVESVCRNDYDLGLSDLLWAHVRAGNIRQGQTPRGTFCEIEFRVYYSALI